MNPIKIFLDDSSNEKGWSSGINKIGPYFIFDVILPSADVYSDLSLVIPWYCNGHYKYAIGMTLPLFAQFLSTTYKWFRLEKWESKRWSWIILLLQCWPQWCAIRIIQLEIQKDEEAEAAKRELMREVTITERFLEAWPSVMMMCFIASLAIFDDSYWSFCDNNNLIFSQEDIYSNRTWTCKDEINPPPQYCEIQPLDNKCAVFSGPGGATWFFISFCISGISGAMGITKVLQNGPFAMLSTEGLLGGVCKCRFILAYFSVLMAILSKGCVMLFLLVSCLIGSTDQAVSKVMKKEIGIPEVGDNLILLIIINGILCLPYFILSLISMSCSTGFNKKLIKVIVNYPATWMLTAYTYFTIGPHESNCSAPSNSNRNLGLSKFYSGINIQLTAIINLAVIFYYASYDLNFLNILTLWSPIYVVGLVINLIFITIDKKSCCSKCCRQDNVVTVHLLNVKNDDLEMVEIDNS